MHELERTLLRQMSCFGGSAGPPRPPRVCVDGFSAAPGFDLTTGWGTPNFGRLGALLAAPDGDHDDDD
jgi:hypothetical protein